MGPIREVLMPNGALSDAARLMAKVQQLEGELLTGQPIGLPNGETVDIEDDEGNLIPAAVRQVVDEHFDNDRATVEEFFTRLAFVDSSPSPMACLEAYEPIASIKPRRATRFCPSKFVCICD